MNQALIRYNICKTVFFTAYNQYLWNSPVLIVDFLMEWETIKLTLLWLAVGPRSLSGGI